MGRIQLWGARFGRRAFWIFLLGFLAGLALIHIGQEGLVKNSGLLDGASIERMGSFRIDRQGFLGYSLRQRFLPAAFLCLLAAAGVGGIAVCLYLIWGGFCAGALLSVLSLRYGIRGALMFAGGIFPQVLLLVPAYLLLLEWCLSLPQRGLGRRNMGQTASGFRLRLPVLAFCLLLSGCFAESYLNPLILEQIIHLFW